MAGDTNLHSGIRMEMGNVVDSLPFGTSTMVCSHLLLCDSLLHPVGPDHVGLSVSILEGVSNNSDTNPLSQDHCVGNQS